jgi:heme-degrading monooxygenase HmoA
VSYTIVWEFRVPREGVVGFEAAYGPDGPWASLFGRAEGFLGVELLRSMDQDARYLTIDRWVSQEAYEAFQARFAAEYEDLDKRLEGVAGTETRIGAFAGLDTSARS